MLFRDCARCLFMFYEPLSIVFEVWEAAVPTPTLLSSLLATDPNVFRNTRSSGIWRCNRSSAPTIGDSPSIFASVWKYSGIWNSFLINSGKFRWSGGWLTSLACNKILGIRWINYLNICLCQGHILQLYLCLLCSKFLTLREFEVKNIFGALIFHWVMWVKLLKKTFVTHNTEMKSLIGLIFCRNMLMDSLQEQLKNGLAEAIFHWVIWVKLLKILKKAFCMSSHSDENSYWAEMLQNMLMGTGTVKNSLAEVILHGVTCFGTGNNFSVWWDIMWLLLHIQISAWGIHCSINFT